MSTCMYYTGVDPRTMQPIYVARDPHEKAMQRALIQYRKPENYKLVREALEKAGRRDLIGYTKALPDSPRAATPGRDVCRRWAWHRQEGRQGPRWRRRQGAQGQQGSRRYVPRAEHCRSQSRGTRGVRAPTEAADATSAARRHAAVGDTTRPTNKMPLAGASQNDSPASGRLILSISKRRYFLSKRP